jgi:hypothetical protein
VILKAKSGSALISPDKHKTLRTRRLPFAFLSFVSYDLEGLGAGARRELNSIVNLSICDFIKNKKAIAIKKWSTALYKMVAQKTII